MVRQHLVQLLVFQALLILFVDVLEASLFVLLETLLDVLFLLFQLKLFAVVSNDFSHAIHDGLDALAPLSHLLFASLFLLQSHSHVLFHLFGLSSLDLFQLSISLFLLP